MLSYSFSSYIQVSDKFELIFIYGVSTFCFFLLICLGDYFISALKNFLILMIPG